MKKFKTIALFITISMVLSLAVVAATAKKNITIELPGIKVYVDGKQITVKNSAGKVADPFIYNGSIYLPAETVGTVTGKAVIWDAKKNALAFSAPKPAASTYSRINPAPVGTAQTVEISDFENSYTAEIKFERLLSGNELASIMGSPVANDKPLAGYEVVAVKAKITITKVKDKSKSVRVNTSQFQAFTSNNESVKDLYIYLKNDNYLDATLYDGGSAEGYIVLQRRIGDKAKMVYGAEYDGSGGIWFSLAE
jgi:hypothetical protein